MVLLAAPNSYTAAAERINRLGPDLLAARDRLGITPAAQAAQVGIGLTTLNGLTSGTTNPAKSTILAALAWLATPRETT